MYFSWTVQYVYVGAGHFLYSWSWFL